jgi:hypothetical protein
MAVVKEIAPAAVPPGRKDVVSRLRRIEGQVAGIRRMYQDGRDCVDVLDQVAAARRGLEATALTSWMTTSTGASRRPSRAAKARRRSASFSRPSAATSGASEMPIPCQGHAAGRSSCAGEAVRR